MRFPERITVDGRSEEDRLINRITITDDEIGGFRVIIPARRNLPLVLFLGFWLCGWAVGEVGVTAGLITGERNKAGIPGSLFMLVWLAGWTVGGTMVLLSLWWNIAGREIIIFTDGAMCVGREIGPLRRFSSFDLNGVRNLRFSPLVYNPFSMSASWAYQLQWLGLAGGAVAFDHDGSTDRFGNGLTETEAARLIVTIRERFKIPAESPVEPLPISK